MKQIQSVCLLCSAVFLLVFSSCKGKGDKKAGDDTTATTTTTTPEEKPANTIVTTPMSMVTVMHKVADFAKWKMAYDADDSARVANGLHSYVIGRGLFDTNMVLIAMKSDDLAKAKAFAQSPALKQVMQKAGVMGAPSMTFSTITWQDTANVGSIPRSLSKFTVNDWNTWLTTFESVSQERKDNGLLTRTVGHDADNDKKVSLVAALADTAKAFAYYKSDMLKTRMKAAGIQGEPERFFFTIVARY